MNKKSKIVLAIVAVILIVFAVVYSKKNNVDNNAAWKTYTSDEYGFTFQYPNNWKIDSSNPKSISLSSPKETQALLVTVYNGTPATQSETYKITDEILDGKQIKKVWSVGPDSGPFENVLYTNNGSQITFTYPKNAIETKIVTSFATSSRVINKLSLKTYTNNKYGYQFQYPDNFYVFSKDAKTGDFVSSTPESDSIFITQASVNLINGNSKENSGVRIYVSDKVDTLPTQIVSKKEIVVGGQKATEYNTTLGIEDTRLEMIMFSMNNKYFTITEWSSATILDVIIPTFKFTTSTTCPNGATNYPHCNADLPQINTQSATTSVVAPNGGEVWKIGSTQKIIWNTGKNLPNDRWTVITLDTDGGPLISYSTTTANYFDWTIQSYTVTGDLLGDMQTGPHKIVINVYDDQPCYGYCVLPPEKRGKAKLITRDESNNFFTIIK